MQFKPVIGIWNPYNVEIRDATYLMDWGLFPWLRYATGDSQGSVKPLPDGSNPIGEVWMRDQWKIKEIDGQTRFRLKTAPVNLRPGEFRMFSVRSQDNMIATNQLTSSSMTSRGARWFLSGSSSTPSSDATISSPASC